MNKKMMEVLTKGNKISKVIAGITLGIYTAEAIINVRDTIKARKERMQELSICSLGKFIRINKDVLEVNGIYFPLDKIDVQFDRAVQEDKSIKYGINWKDQSAIVLTFYVDNYAYERDLYKDYIRACLSIKFRSPERNYHTASFNNMVNRIYKKCRFYNE